MSARTEILIRGDEAARAKRIDLIQPMSKTSLQAVGPWADELDQARETARKDGFEQGRRDGWEVGRREMDEQIEAEATRHADDLASVSTAIEALLAELRSGADELDRRLADQTVELALEIAAAVLGREVAASDDPGAEALARCLDMAPATGDLVARLHPEDAAELGKLEGLNGRDLTIVPDAGLERGDAVVVVDDAMIDARMSESLRRVGEALR